MLAQPYLFINFKLSPAVCEAAYAEGVKVNELTWNLILPNRNAIEAAERPQTSFEWLDLANVYVESGFAELFPCLTEIIMRDDDHQHVSN
jgi:hypothetical protein